MKLTQGCFSFLPDLTDEQISKQMAWAIRKSWAVSIEFTDDPHPRNSYWEMWGLPLFDVSDPAAILFELKTGCKVFQKQWEWFIGNNQETKSFVDGMILLDEYSLEIV